MNLDPWKREEGSSTDFLKPYMKTLLKKTIPLWLLFVGLVMASCSQKNEELMDSYDRTTKEFVAAIAKSDEKKAREKGKEIGEIVTELRKRKLSLKEQAQVIRITQQMYTDLANIDYTKLDYNALLAPLASDTVAIKKIESNENVSRVKKTIEDSISKYSEDDIRRMLNL